MSAFLETILTNHIVFIILFLLVSTFISVITRNLSLAYRMIFTVTIFGGYYYIQIIYPEYIHEAAGYFTQFKSIELPLLVI